MKKLILVLLLLISSISFAQRIEFIDSTGHIRQVSAKYPLPTIASVTFPDSLKVYSDSTSKSIKRTIYQDTLTSVIKSTTYSFGFQYPRVKISVYYDSTSVHNDSLRIYNIGENNDTTDVYLLDSVNGRVLYITNSGDKKYKEWRLDIWCPENLMIVYSDATVYTTKWVYILKGVSY